MGYEGWLGGRVVAHALAPWIVTAHLIVAVVIVQLLLYATFQAMAPQSHDTSDRAIGIGAAVLIAVTLFQAGVGTQVRGTIDDVVNTGVARGSALATVGRLDVMHRDLAFVTLIVATLLVLWLLSKRSSLVSWGYVVLLLAIVQIAIGAYMAYGALVPAAQVLHLTIASLLLGAETVLWLQSRRPSLNAHLD